MARLRKFAAYRAYKRPYTRFSKYSNKNFVAAKPVCRVVRFDMGEQRTDYTHHLKLVSVTPVTYQIRDNAIESARLSGNKVLEGKYGKTGYFFRAKLYPHHILRENPLASGAGADRMSTGMAHSFGKPIGLACQVKPKQIVFELFTTKDKLEVGKLALKRASYKIPNHYHITVSEIGKKVVKKAVKAKTVKQQISASA